MSRTFFLHLSLIYLVYAAATAAQQNIKTTVHKVGYDKTSIVTLDNVLSKDIYTSIRDSLRSRGDFVEGHENHVSFPGKIATLDRIVVDPIIKTVTNNMNQKEIISVGCSNHFSAENTDYIASRLYSVFAKQYQWTLIVLVIAIYTCIEVFGSLKVLRVRVPENDDKKEKLANSLKRSGRKIITSSIMVYIAMFYLLLLAVQAVPFTEKSDTISNDISSCDFDVINAGDLTVLEFEHKYKIGPGRRPVLIRGAASKWKAIQTWTQDFLNHEMRKLNVNITKEYFFRRIDISSGKIILKSPKKDIIVPPSTTKNMEYYSMDLNRLVQPPSSFTTEKSFSFPSQGNDKTFRPLDFVDLSANSCPWFRDKNTFEYYISAGIDESGLFFHQHGEAWNALIIGHKRWMLVSPKHNIPQLTALPHLGNITSPYQCEHIRFKSQWLKNSLPKIQKHERPLECDQKVGDVLYIPDGWFHAVQNVGELTVAVNGLNKNRSITSTSVKFVGNAKTPIIVLDDMLPELVYVSLRDSLRSRVDFVEGIAFPGKIATLDRAIVNPIINAILSSQPLTDIYPKEIFEQKEYITGFVSILCNPGHVHSDDMNTQHQGIVSPAAVFYFGFDGTLSTTTITKTGTAFYREKESGLERATSIVGNETDFCAASPNSLGCLNHKKENDAVDINGINGSNTGADHFEEIHRVLGIANRLVIYPKDILHNAWVEDEFTGTSNEYEDGDKGPSLPCSPQEGRLAISLFFLSRPGVGTEIVDVIHDEWRAKATMTLQAVPEQVKESRRKLEEWVLLDACAAFVKGSMFNMVNVASCALSVDTTIVDGETLRIRGIDSLDHPELNRGGKAVRAHHFVMTGTSNLTLMNLKLSGAYNGHPGGGQCGYCRQNRWWYNDCPGNCNSADDGGALLIQSATTTTILFDMIFTSNTAYSSTGNIFSTSSSATLYLISMVTPTQMVGVKPIILDTCNVSKQVTKSICNSTSNISYSEYYHKNDLLCITNITTSNARCGCPLGYYASNACMGPCLACPNGRSSKDSGAESLSECTSCSVGQFQTIKSNVLSCFICPAGYYQEKAGEISCKACQKGKFLTAGKSDPLDHNLETKCLPCQPGLIFLKINLPCPICQAGQYQDKVTSDGRNCKLCPGGFALADNSYEQKLHEYHYDCVRCNAGLFSPSGAASCTNCLEGQYTNKTGAVVCTKCPGGTALPVPGSTTPSDCKQCIAGQYSSEPSGALSCTQCLKGSYSKEVGASLATTCLKCISGHYQLETGKTSCHVCVGGRYSTEITGATSCTSCLKGSYSAEVGASVAIVCKNCKKGRHQANGGATFCSNCTVGRYVEESGRIGCKNCLANHYQPKEGQINCNLSCPEETYSEPGSSKCKKVVAGTIPPSIVFAIVFGILCLIGGGFVFYRRRKKQFIEDNELTHQLLSETMDERAALVADREKLQLAWVVKYQDISLEAAIGAGAFGEVWRGSWRGIAVAIKKVFPSVEELMQMELANSERSETSEDSDSDSDDDSHSSSAAVLPFDSLSNNTVETDSNHQLNKVALEMLQNLEIGVMMRLRHPRIVAFLGAGELIDPPCIDKGETEPKIGVFVMLEFASGGDLTGRLEDAQGSVISFPWSERVQCAMDIAEGMVFIHSQGLIHRDLKSMNILCDANGRCMIADLGLVRENINAGVNQGPSNQSVQFGNATTWQGTSAWMAPEVRNSNYTESVDVYSFGMIMWELLTCRIPWFNSPYSFAHQILMAVLSGARPIATKVEKKYAPAEFLSLMKRCWETDEWNRPSFKAIFAELEKIKLDTSHAGWDIQSNWQVNANDIVLGTEIGRGSFGVVLVAQYNGMTVAVKTIETGGNREAKAHATKLLLSEVKILAKVVHSNIVQLIGACVNPPMLLMAHASGGSLRSLLDQYEEGTPLPSDRGIEILRGICDGMAALHAVDILHLDLKPPNVLMSSNSLTAIPWVTDFGLSMAIQETAKSLSSASSMGGPKTARGTLQYKAPELFRTRKMGGPSYKKPADVYSFAMMAWEVFSGEVPFAGKMESEITTGHVLASRGLEDPERPDLDNIPASMHSLLKSCWLDSPEERMTFAMAQEMFPQDDHRIEVSSQRLSFVETKESIQNKFIGETKTQHEELEEIRNKYQPPELKEFAKRAAKEATVAKERYEKDKAARINAEWEELQSAATAEERKEKKELKKLVTKENNKREERQREEVTRLYMIQRQAEKAANEHLEATEKEIVVDTGPKETVSPLIFSMKDLMAREQAAKEMAILEVEANDKARDKANKEQKTEKVVTEEIVSPRLIFSMKDLLAREQAAKEMIKLEQELNKKN